MDWIVRAWRGQERLWKVFWLYNVLLGIAFCLALGFIPLLAPSVTLAAVLSVVSTVAYFGFVIWILVAEWRCAFNVNWSGWGYIMRGLIVLSVLSFILAIVVGFIVGFSSATKNKSACLAQLSQTAAAEGLSMDEFRIKYPDSLKHCMDEMKKSF